MLADLITLVSLISAAAGSTSFYQIVLTQKGFTQFIEYDVLAPTLSEFTFCVWIRTHDLSKNQSIFTYVANSNRPLLSVWLEAGGGSLHTRLGRGQPDSVTPVDWTVGVWRHFCLSWQADSGAWATYQDGNLLSCLASETLFGYVFPGGGRMLLGYGAVGSAGTNNGWEGDMYGFNMILSSTIERNYSLHNSFNASKEIKIPLTKNKMLNNVFKYVTIGDLDAETTKEDITEGKNMHTYAQDVRSHIKFNTPHSRVEHDVGLVIPPFTKMSKYQTYNVPKTSLMRKPIEKDSLGVNIFNSEHAFPTKGVSTLWNIINKAGKEGKFKKSHLNIHEQTKIGTEDLPVLSEFETPPPINDLINFELHSNEPNHVKQPIKEPPHTFTSSMEDITKTHASVDEILFKTDRMLDRPMPDPLPTISMMETPPKKFNDDKVYGYWTGNTFAGSVLEFLKHKNIHSKPIPKTISLKKISDNFPYASEQKPFKNFPTRSAFHLTHLLPKPMDKIIRRARSPERNIEVIIDKNLRTYISRKHANDEATDVQVTPRGESSNKIWHTLDDDKIDFRKNTERPNPFRLKNHNMENTGNDLSEPSPLSKAMPFITTRKLEDSAEHFETSRGNKWRNIQTFNDNFSSQYNSNTYVRHQNNHDTLFSDNLYVQSLPQPSIQLNPESEHRQMNQNRAIALTVSKMSDLMNGAVPIIPIKNGVMYPKDRNKSLLHYTPYNSHTVHISPKILKSDIVNIEDAFYKPVKLGNALNEFHIIGKNDEEKRKSFIEGDDKIPDIHRHRSDDENGEQIQNKIPPSLGPRVCEQTVYSEQQLFVQPDGSIDLSRVYSSVTKKNPGIRFVEESYNKCVQKDLQSVQHSFLMLIRWKQTPVRLFGGAMLKRSNDLCMIF